MSDPLGHDVTGPAGAPVLFCGPSLGAARRIWRGPAAALADRYRVVSFDLPGHGTSPAPAGPPSIATLGRAVLDLYDTLGVERASYAGISLGGMIGMWLAANAPDRVDRLALVCTSAYLPPADGWTDRAAQVRAYGTASIAAAVVARWFTGPFRAVAPRVVAAHEAMVAECPDEGYAACCEAIAAMDLRPSLPRIGAPTLVVAGADDPAIPPPHGEAIAAAVAGARSVVLDGAAHLPVVECEAEVTALLTGFLADR